MDATAWVGIAGIAGTLMAPIISERMRREGAHRDLLRTHRLLAYADLLKAVARLADNALTWSSSPTAELRETPNEELDAVIARVRVVASKEIYRGLMDLMHRVHVFNGCLSAAQISHNRVVAEGHVDDDATVRQRMQLAELAYAVRDAHGNIENAIRREMSL